MKITVLVLISFLLSCTASRRLKYLEEIPETDREGFWVKLDTASGDLIASPVMDLGLRSPSINVISHQRLKDGVQLNCKVVYKFGGYTKYIDTNALGENTNVKFLKSDNAYYLTFEDTIKVDYSVLQGISVKNKKYISYRITDTITHNNPTFSIKTNKDDESYLIIYVYGNQNYGWVYSPGSIF